MTKSSCVLSILLFLQCATSIHVCELYIQEDQQLLFWSWAKPHSSTAHARLNCHDPPASSQRPASITAAMRPNIWGGFSNVWLPSQFSEAKQQTCIVHNTRHSHPWSDVIGGEWREGGIWVRGWGGVLEEEEEVQSVEVWMDGVKKAPYQAWEICSSLALWQNRHYRCLGRDVGSDLFEFLIDFDFNVEIRLVIFEQHFCTLTLGSDWFCLHVLMCYFWGKVAPIPDILHRANQTEHAPPWNWLDILSHFHSLFEEVRIVVRVLPVGFKRNPFYLSETGRNLSETGRKDKLASKQISCYCFYC